MLRNNLENEITLFSEVAWAAHSAHKPVYASMYGMHHSGEEASTSRISSSPNMDFVEDLKAAASNLLKKNIN